MYPNNISRVSREVLQRDLEQKDPFVAYTKVIMDLYDGVKT